MFILCFAFLSVDCCCQIWWSTSGQTTAGKEARRGRGAAVPGTGRDLGESETETLQPKATRRDAPLPAPVPALPRPEPLRQLVAESHGLEPMPTVPAARASVRARPAGDPTQKAGTLLPEPALRRRGMHRPSLGP